MIKINVKPLSVNEAWQGKRFKTDVYKRFERLVLLSLPNLIDIPKGKLKLFIKFGVSSKLSDWDNPVKPFQDILQKKYKFNDRDIYSAVVEKVDVKTGCEFIEFKIEQHENISNEQR